MPAQGSYAAQKLNKPKYDKQEHQKEVQEEFRIAYEALSMNGDVPVADMAEYLNVSDKTVYARLKRFRREFVLDKGKIHKVSNGQKTGPKNEK